MLDAIKKDAEDLAARMTEWRRWFHSHPELSFAETETTARICEILREIGFDGLKIGVSGVRTGIVAELRGPTPGGTIALRADIDALPIHELNDVPYKSQNDGVMHACGHDGHIAILLGAASILYKRRRQLNGSVRLIFQPSEEAGEGGAKPMIEEGALNGVDAIAGLHLWQPAEKGCFAYAPGAAMASADTFRITVRGKGGHGAQPDETIDPVVTAAYIVCELQSIISREINPLNTGVITVGKIISGTAANIIPETALIEGTIRALAPATRELLSSSLSRIAGCVAQAHKCTAGIEIVSGYPPTVNSDAFLKRAVTIAGEVAGLANVRKIPPSMCAEDMGFYLERVTGCYIFLGMAGGTVRPSYPHHNPRFDVDDGVLGLGAAYMAYLALDYLRNSSAYE